MSDCYDIDGNPIDLMTWAKLFEQKRKDGYGDIGKTDLENGLFVSTVWLGLDHGFSGKPLIFETMVFDQTDAEHDGSNLDCERYSTKEEANKGHEEMCEKWKAKKPFLFVRDKCN